MSFRNRLARLLRRMPRTSAMPFWDWISGGPEPTDPANRELMQRVVDSAADADRDPIEERLAEEAAKLRPDPPPDAGTGGPGH